MAFGKRVAPVPSGLSAGPRDAGVAHSATPAMPMTHPEFTERIRLLLADLSQLNTHCISMADALRDGERPRTDLSRGLVPEAFPFDISSFARHFNFQREGKLRHSVLCYTLESDMLDRKAQLHLLEATTAIMAFNRLCVRGYEDDALSIVMNSPPAMQGIDKTIVMSSLFCGLLQNLLYQQSVLAGRDGVQVRKFDPARMKTCIEDWLGKARRAMLAPDTYAALMPDLPSPAILAEADIADHPGQLVVNQVYLPVDLAGPVMARMAAA
jgi:hypothetical protein